ncbi:MAG: protoporphyrinogen oxidase [Puniceicoccales bacterium]|nr:protoporphyrinogen oxidase [Puniceicoccales bacterium]
MGADVIIIGGGIAGLTVATSLLRGGLTPLVMEKASHVGGSVSSLRENGFLCERGPNSLMLEEDGTEVLIRQLGIVPLEANLQAKKRFLVCRGKPVAAPSGPVSAMTSPLLSFGAKLRFLFEPFASAAQIPEESVAQFARRRLGPEAVSRLIDPMIAGIYAGDPELLSLKHALPRLAKMEELHGSLMLAGIKKRRAAPKRRIVNFETGMSAIPEAMIRFLGNDRVQTGVEIKAIDSLGEGWSVSWHVDGKTRRTTARSLVITTPTWTWENTPLPSGLSRHLRPCGKVNYPPVSVVSLGFAREHVSHPLDGFGMLVPKCEQRKILGTLFQSSLFPHRAPQGHVLLTTFIGGSRQPELTALDKTAQIALVREEFHALLGISSEPVFENIRCWSHAIPQYQIGYGKILTILDEAERNCTGLYFCGNYRGGISVSKTIFNAHNTAQRVLASIKA